jgi:hypothetical protein
VEGLHDMDTVKINIPFEAIVESGKELYAHVTHADASIHTYGRAAKAKKELQAQLTTLVNDALKSHRMSEATLMSCQDGTVLVVRFAHGSWHYSIARSTRGYAGSVVSGMTYEQTCEAARAHAGQSYGGVVWESTL